MKGNINMRKRLSIIFIFIFILCLLVSGCQETPDQSAIVSKENGLSSDVIIDPMENGMFQKHDIPKQWKMNVKRSNDRVSISADLQFGEKEIGNLPVIEMKRHVMSQEELERLVTYFAGEEEIYVPQPYSKEIYEEVIERIENQEGIYEDTYYWIDILKIKQSAELALEEIVIDSDTKENAEIKFTKRFVDQVFEKAILNKIAIQDFNLYENRDKNIWFEADVGTNREAYIQAEKFDSTIGNSSKFIWEEGKTLQYQEVSSDKMFYEGQERNLSVQRILTQIQLFEELYKQNNFDNSIGRKEAERILEELKIEDMVLASCEPVLWFPKKFYPEGCIKLGDSGDLYWLVDLSKAETGYSYTFSRNIQGLNVVSGKSTLAKKTEEVYVPPFPVEKITITVTESGVKAFQWLGMSEEVTTIASNTKLLSFDRIQENLVNQIFYWYAAKGQPVNDETKFFYDVRKAELGYTYVTAFKNPNHAWLIPTWMFTVIEGKDGQERQYLFYLIDALEGRTIIGE